LARAASADFHFPFSLSIFIYPYPMPALAIDSALKTKCPGSALGLLIARVNTFETPSALLGEMKSAEAQILQVREPRALLECSKILATRSGYKALGKDPARYRGSAEALLRRILSGKSLPQINCVVDIINLVSVESRFPIGLYDLAYVHGSILFRAGLAGETYKGIGKYDLNLEGLPVFCDEMGPHGSPTSDSERTMVTSATRHVAAVLVSFGGPDDLQSALDRMSALLQKYADARDIRFEIIS
jgi:DNA/RNA-binding domain of Phe-tRNA-synthetase-like protein